MSHSRLTSWIEDAEAREVALQGAMLRRVPEIGPSQYFHLGSIIAKVSAWRRHYHARRAPCIYEPVARTTHLVTELPSTEALDP
jgi:hypothetical protein